MSKEDLKETKTTETNDAQNDAAAGDLADSVKNVFSRFFCYLGDRNVDHWLFFLVGFILGGFIFK